LHLGKVLFFYLIGNVTKISDVDSILMEEVSERSGIGWYSFVSIQVLDQGLDCFLLQEFSKLGDFLFFYLDFIIGHCKLHLFEDIGVVHLILAFLKELLEFLNLLQIELLVNLCHLLLVFFGWLFSFFNLWLSFGLLLLKFFLKVLHLGLCTLEVLLSLI